MHPARRGTALLLALATIASIAAVTLTGAPGAQADPAGAPAAGRAAAGAIAVGYVNSCVLLDGGSIRCWGSADQGVLGQGTGVGTAGSLDLGDDELPTAGTTVPLGAGRTATSVTMRYKHACALLDNGAIRCWGNGEEGVLGYGGTAVIGDDELPTTIGTVDLGGATATAVTAGWHHTCALLTGGAVRCWGQNNAGQLGTGTAGTNVGDDETPASAQNVALPRPAVAISAGRFHTCALLDDGSVRCWGVNNAGQLGTGDNENVGDDEAVTLGTAVDLGVGRTAVAVAAGYEHSCAILDNGTLRCWGLNGNGQLGLGTTTGTNTAAAVALDAGRTVVGVALGYDNTCVTLDDGTARCWGSNHVGQLALGTDVPLVGGEVPDPQNPVSPSLGDNELPTTMPVIAMGGTVQFVATGTFHSCALLTGRTVKCWGAGGNGRLGYGDDLRRGAVESPADYGTVVTGGPVGAVATTTTTTSTTTTSTTTTSTTTTTVPTTPTTAPPTTAPPTTAPPTTVPPVPPQPPADTTAPDLKVLHASPIRVGSSGRVCTFLMSDEVAITGIAVTIPGKGTFRSAAIGVGPTFPQFLCLTLPRSARPTRPTTVTLTGAALDLGVNIRFVVRQVTITR